MMLRDERGNAAIELVLIAPALLLLIAVVASAGRIFSTKSALESIARESARVASQADSGAAAQAEAEARALESAAGMGIDTARLSVVTDPGAFERGAPLKVTVAYDVKLADLPGFGVLPGLFSVKAQHVEIIERYKSR